MNNQLSVHGIQNAEVELVDIPDQETAWVNIVVSGRDHPSETKITLHIENYADRNRVYAQIRDVGKREG